MAVKGIFQSHQNVVGERATDFAGSILKYYPTGMATFFALSAGIPDNPIEGSTQFHWEEDSHISGRQPIVSGGTTNTIRVLDGSFYLPNQFGMVEETGEYIFIMAVVNNDLTVVRGHANTTIVSVNNTMNFQLLGNAFEEASSKPNSITQNGVPRTNIAQIFRNGWSISGTAKKIKLMVDDESRITRNRNDCAQYHSEDMERTFMWGRMNISTLNGKQIRFTDGIITQIEKFGGRVRTAISNFGDGNGAVAGQFHLRDLETFIREIFSVNVKGMPNERMVFIGDVALEQIGRMVRADSQYEIHVMETEYGIKITSIVTVFGTLKFVTHPMMSESPVWTREMYVFHMGGLARRTFRATWEENYEIGRASCRERVSSPV